MRPSGEIGLVLLMRDKLIPSISVAIQGAGAMAVNVNVVSAHDESGRLVLVADIERVLQPVLDICAPLLIISQDPSSVENQE